MRERPNPGGEMKDYIRVIEMHVRQGDEVVVYRRAPDNKLLDRILVAEVPYRYKHGEGIVGGCTVADTPVVPLREITEYEQKIVDAIENLDQRRRGFTVSDLHALRKKSEEKYVNYWTELKWRCSGCGEEKIGYPIYFHGPSFTEAKAYCVKCHVTNPEPEPLFDPRLSPRGFGEEW